MISKSAILHSINKRQTRMALAMLLFAFLVCGGAMYWYVKNAPSMFQTAMAHAQAQAMLELAQSFEEAKGNGYRIANGPVTATRAKHLDAILHTERTSHALQVLDASKAHATVLNGGDEIDLDSVYKSADLAFLSKFPGIRPFASQRSMAVIDGQIYAVNAVPQATPAKATQNGTPDNHSLLTYVKQAGIALGILILYIISGVPAKVQRIERSMPWLRRVLSTTAWLGFVGLITVAGWMNFWVGVCCLTVFMLCSYQRSEPQTRKNGSVSA